MTLKNSRFCEITVIWSIVSLITPLVFSMTVFNPMVSVFERMYNGTYYARNGVPMPFTLWNTLLSWTFSLPLLTGVVGAMSTKFLIKKLGRKGCTILAHSMFVLSNGIVALVGGLTHSYEAIIIGRFMTGLPFGLSFNIATVLASEMSVRSRQSFLQTIIGLSIALGTVLGPVAGYKKVLGTDALWPLAVAVGTFPGIAWLITSPWMVETPYHLLRIGKRQEAEDVLKKLRKYEKGDIEEEIQAIENEQSAGDSNQSKIVGIREVLRVPHYRRPFIAVILMYLNYMLSGVNSVVLYSDSIFLSAGISEDSVTLATIGVFSAEVVMALIGSKVINKFGGRKTNILGNFVMTFSLILLTASLAFRDNVPGLGYLSIISLLIFILGFSGGSNIATYTIIGEVTNDPIRPTCLTYGSIVFWIIGWFVGFIPPYFQIAFGNFSMVPWIICLLTLTMYMVFVLPETRGLSVDQVQKLFSK